jgi:hypothetical protein
MRQCAPATYKSRGLAMTQLHGTLGVDAFPQAPLSLARFADSLMDVSGALLHVVEYLLQLTYGIFHLLRSGLHPGGFCRGLLKPFFNGG